MEGGLEGNTTEGCRSPHSYTTDRPPSAATEVTLGPLTRHVGSIAHPASHLKPRSTSPIRLDGPMQPSVLRLERSSKQPFDKDKNGLHGTPSRHPSGNKFHTLYVHARPRVLRPGLG
jgi:hypothetical protein